MKKNPRVHTTVSETQPRNRMAENLDKVEETGEVVKVRRQKPPFLPRWRRRGRKLVGKVEKDTEEEKGKEEVKDEFKNRFLRSTAPSTNNRGP